MRTLSFSLASWIVACIVAAIVAADVSAAAARPNVIVVPRADGVVVRVQAGPVGGTRVLVGARRVATPRARDWRVLVPKRLLGTPRRVTLVAAASGRTFFARRLVWPKARPIIRIAHRPAGITSSRRAVIRWAVRGALTRTTCKVDAGRWTRCGSPLTLSRLADGPHRVAIRARNPIGSRTVTVRWRVTDVPSDAPAAPTVELTAAPSGRTTDSSATIRFTTTGANVSVTCRLDGGASAPCTSPVELKSLTTGDHDFAVEARNAGGVARASAAWAVDPPSGAPVADEPVARFSRVSQGWLPVITNVAQDANRYQIIILQGYFKNLARQLKAANPNVKVIMYKNVTSTIQDAVEKPDTAQGSGVDYVQALRDAPSWFLADPTGTKISRPFGNTRQFFMDVGSAGYQDRWASNVIAQAKRDGWDGVFMDDTMPTAKYWVPSHLVTDVTKYPSDAAYGAASRSFMQNVGNRFRANGLVAVASTCCNNDYGHRADWAQFLAGTADEGFLNPSTGTTTPLSYAAGGWQDWRLYMQAVVDAEAAGRYMVTMLRGAPGNVPRNRYGLATYLLAANGHTSYTYQASDREAAWMPDFDVALRLGAPTSTFTRLPSGVYQRVFANGIVLVNPNAPGTPAVTTPLPGTYTGSELTNVRSATLAPGTGAIMLAS